MELPDAVPSLRRIQPTALTVAPSPRLTKLQGRYLAFIAAYAKLHGVPPAEADMQRYLKVTPPSVHRMILALERGGLIARTPGVARSIQLLVSSDELPALEEAGQPEEQPG